MTMHGVFHPELSTARLYNTSRQEEEVYAALKMWCAKESRAEVLCQQESRK